MGRKIVLFMEVLVLSAFCLLSSGCSLIEKGIEALRGPRVEQELDAEDIYNEAIESIVEINGEASGMTSTGTGFFYDKNGTVITNYHVIEGCTTATITLHDGKSYDVENVLGYSKLLDIAILSTTCEKSHPLEIRTSSVETGEKVYAIGSSLGLSGSLSNGIVSTASREVNGSTYIQTTAPISQGNSGGPLLDKEGKVVGITSATFTEGQNLNLAIPIAEIHKISLDKPTTLAMLFVAGVEWLSEGDFWYYQDYESYVLVFELADNNETPMTASGSVDIQIVNNDGKTVYSAVREFGEVDFEEWIYDDSIEKFLATIRISPDEIAQGNTAEGKVYFTVSGEDFVFDAMVLETYELPVLPARVEWLSEGDFWYYEDYESYVLVFELADESRVAMTANGNVHIKIVSKDGQVVYDKIREFSEADFEEWTYDNSIDKYLATIEIKPNEIAKGTTPEGKVYYTVTGEDFIFEEMVLSTSELPVLPVQLETPSLPKEVSYIFASEKWSSVRIDNVSFEVSGETDLCLYFTGEKIYDKYGTDNEDLCSFTWKLYDSEGYLLDSGTVFTGYLVVGDKFRNVEAYSWGKVKAGEKYSLVISDYK